MSKILQEWSSSGLHKKGIEILKVYFKDDIFQDKKILVIGSGSGHFESLLLNELSVKPENITSCDIDPSHFAISLIQCKKINVDDGLPFDDNMFDLIVILEVIEHLENQWNILREIKRVKKDTGICLLSSPNVEGIFNKVYYLVTGKMSFFSKSDYEISGHINPLFSWNLLRMLDKNNMKILHYDSNLFYFWIVPFFLKIRIPFKSILFAQLNIFLIR